MITRIPVFKRFISTAVAAQILEIHVGTMRRLAHSGRIPAYQHGSSGDLKFYEDDVLEFMLMVATGQIKPINRRQARWLMQESAAA